VSKRFIEQAGSRLRKAQMIDRSKLSNSFEFVVTAGARARQLMAGSVPRVVVGEHKKTTVAQQEVVTKAVEKIENEKAKLVNE
jgi:DNA-directed RNA polymerase subunit K/omega